MGVGLICVGISMVVGVLWGCGDKVFGAGRSGLEVVEKVGIVVVLGGRAWVSSLPKFFL